MTRITGYYKGIPIYPMPKRHFYNGMFKSGKIYVRESLDIPERIKTIKHEYHHYQYNSRHRILGRVFGHILVQITGLFCYAMSLYLGLPFLAVASLVPWGCVLAQELHIYHSMGDWHMTRTLLSLFLPLILVAGIVLLLQ